MPKPSENLFKMKEILSQPGVWVGYNPYKEPEHQCLATALHIAGLSCTGVEYRLLWKLTGRDYISRWNDQHGRTLEEVLTLLDQAIALAKQEEGI